MSELQRIDSGRAATRLANARFVDHLWFVGERAAATVGILFAAALLYSLGANLVDKASNVAVLFGVVIAAGTVIATALALVYLGRDVLRHFRPLMIAAIAIVLALSSAACTKVPPGWAGIRVDLYGRQRGVRDFPIKTGRVWYNPFTEEIYMYPTFMQNVTWTASLNEGAAYDQSITVNSVEGATVNFDVGIGYHLDYAKVPQIFVEFREDAATLTNVYIHNKVRDGFAREASAMKISDIYGPLKSQLERNVQHEIENELGPKGIHFDYVSIIGKMRVPPDVESAINGVIEATQQAIQAQNRVTQAKAEAEQRVAEADGVAQSTLIKAKAQSDANRILNESLTPALIQYEAVVRWNGTLPQVTGSGALPMINLPISSASTK